MNLNIFDKFKEKQSEVEAICCDVVMRRVEGESRKSGSPLIVLDLCAMMMMMQS